MRTRTPCGSRSGWEAGDTRRSPKRTKIGRIKPHKLGTIGEIINRFGVRDRRDLECLDGCGGDATCSWIPLISASAASCARFLASTSAAARRSSSRRSRSNTLHSACQAETYRIIRGRETLGATRLRGAGVLTAVRFLGSEVADEVEELAARTRGLPPMPEAGPD